MSSNMATAQTHEPVVLSGEIRCALSGRLLRADEAYWAPPLITTRELFTTLTRTLFTNPGSLGQVLLGELPNVPYAPEMRERLAQKRTAEQLKLLGLLLVIAAVFIVPIVMLMA